LGAGFIVLGEFCFASMGVGIRLASTELPNAMIVFGRNLIGLMLLTPWLLRRGVGDLKTAVPGLHLLRAFAGIGAMYCFFYAIARLPLAEAMLLKLTAPIFIPVIAILWLKEQVSALLWLAVAVGFAGVIVILGPEPGSDWDGVSVVALIGLFGGVLAAVAKVTVRRLSKSEPTGRIVFYFAFCGVSLSCLPLFWAWESPSTRGLLLLLGIGTVATLGQLSLTRGLSLAPASRMGAFGYFSVVFGAGYGWVFWGEPLTLALLVGTLLIVLGGLIASRVGRLAPVESIEPLESMPDRANPPHRVAPAEQI
jgi:drug/metabolite transporter (DMT)-like permease